ncbi:MAG TPA: ferrous iron transport protein B [Planctomycetaceae bacterium]|jgi:ferrous iron transport protein B|nr:ferrous iron transport protein B [Planctomycetaceae bacterium]
MDLPTPTAVQPRTITVALIGNPNTGKSTLFNALAGMQARVGNYPGVTVEKKIGRARWGETTMRLVDLPGTYSLAPRSPDEMVSVDVLLGRQPDVGPIDAVLCIVDASNIERNLFLVSQVLDLGLPTVLVLNMCDVARQREAEIDVSALSHRLGLRVIPTEAHRRLGIDEVRQAIVTASESPAPSRAPLFPRQFYEECAELSRELHGLNGNPVPRYLVERLLLDVDGYVEKSLSAKGTRSLGEPLARARERLAQAGFRVPTAEAKVRYAAIRTLLDGVVRHPSARRATLSDRIDHLLTHRVSGLLVFVAVMFVVFQSIYTWARPFMSWIEMGQKLVRSSVASQMSPGALQSLLCDGVIGGVGSVIIFVPQIVFLFLFIAILEDCGYMARAAFLMDRLMSRLGLSGKSFIPLMSSFACAIPGIMATRVIENRRDRMVTILVAPLMSCSARLPVYVLLIWAFIPADTYLGGWVSLRGLVLLAMSSVGAIVAVPVAWAMKKTLFRSETPPFVMELPTYKIPSLRVVLHRAYDRGKAFVTRAGTLIFATAIVVWFAGYYPADHHELNGVLAEIQAREKSGQSGDPVQAAALKRLDERQNVLGGRLIEESFLGRLGHAIEPAVRPLGWDWRIGVGAIASFPAREVIIATLGTIYSLGSDVDESNQSLMDSMRNATRPDGKKVYNVPVALSIMVFFALCAQCAGTLMTIKRETNSWIWPAFTFVYMTLLAYLGALLTYQIGMLL